MNVLEISVSIAFDFQKRPLVVSATRAFVFTRLLYT